jgi:hypothetical protein
VNELKGLVPVGFRYRFSKMSMWRFFLAQAKKNFAMSAHSSTIVNHNVRKQHPPSNPRPEKERKSLTNYSGGHPES